jgi:hypothetical protein
VEEGNQNPERYTNNKPGATAPRFTGLIWLVRVVVAVVDKVIRDGMAMGGVEFFEEGLGDCLLMFLDLGDEAVGLLGAQGMNVVPVEVDILEVAQFIDLILADGWLILLALGNLEGLGDHVRMEPILGGHGDPFMVPSDPLMTPVDVGVGKTGTRDADGGTTAGAAEGVVGSPTPDAQRGALGTKVPTNPGEEFDAAAKSKKAHDANTRLRD